MRDREDDVECSMASLSSESLPDTARSFSAVGLRNIVR